MKKIIYAILTITSFSVFAADSCKLTDKRGFHPDGTPYARVKVACTDIRLQSELLDKYDDYRIGNTDYFQKEVKKEIIKDIQSAGYRKVNDGHYQLQN